ncbi:heavy metal-binding protein HIP-like isoform X2 [Dreissena polymorpha]|uniref:heavy metal-binding protein HIP-like isoform X2 n=1 Tax=Dreissena polymorpha TaxID=45954 RepID=UPI002263C84C|nr:heavy metal-binding protein HIP-like isoform X2 [Dreissena polymorpha]
MRAIECVLVVACALLRAHAAEPSCPVCSKYHYEEMLLERMIRNEIKWEQIVNDMKSINDKVNSALDDASVKIEQMTSRLEKQNQVVDEASGKIQNLTLGLDKQKGVVYAASVKIENLTLGLEKQKLDMDLITLRSQNLTNVLFFARTPKDAALTNNQIAIFNTVVVNTGQGYARDTGKFTAPVSGIYIFAVQYCSQANQWGCLEIVKNGTTLQNSVNHAGSNYACSSMQAFATVAAGEQIWVRSDNGWTGNCYLSETNPYYWSSFSGVLIHT